MLCVYSSVLFGQRTIIFNPSLDNFLLNKGTNNTSSFDFDTVSSYAIYKNQLGLLSDIREIYFDVSIPIHKKHLFGLKTYTEQETTLFSKNKFSGFYAYKLRLRSGFEWSMAAQVGLANVVFGGSEKSSGGSAWAPELSVSTTLHWTKTKLGVTLHQISNSRLQPIGYEFQLKPYLNLYVNRSFQLNANISLESGLEIQKGSDFTLWKFNHVLLIQKHYGITATLMNNKGVSFGAYAEMSAIKNGFFIGFAYNTFFARQQVAQNTVSVSLFYSPRRGN